MRYGGFVLLVLVVFTVAKFWAWIGVVIAIAVLLVVSWKMTGWLDQALEARERRLAALQAAREAKRDALARRCVEQDRQWAAGDDHGIYGNYPPAVQ